MCINCPNSIAGAKYEGPNLSGTPFVVLTWQDCCASCQLNVYCAAWAHYTPTGGGSQMCYLRASITSFNATNPDGNRAITGTMPARSTISPPPQPPPPMLSTSVPPPPPLLPRYVLDVQHFWSHLRSPLYRTCTCVILLVKACMCVPVINTSKGSPI